MKMKKQVRMISMKKRAIAFLMAFAMVMSLLPGTAVWAGEVEDGEHNHSWEYEENGNVIMATCKGEGKCEHEGKEITLTITATNMAHTGEAYTGAVMEDNISGVTGVVVGEIEYYTDAICEIKTNAENSGAENEGGAPKNEGTYYAAVKLGDKKAVKEFDITAHGHSWGYEENGNVITAACTGEGSCEYKSQGITLTITATNMAYTGEAYTGAVMEDNISGVTGMAAGEIEYYTDAACKIKTNAENSGAENEGGAPKNEGTYYAAVKLGDKKAVKEFDITAHGHSWRYEENGNVITATCTGEGSCEYKSQGITLTITATNMAYTGEAYTGAVMEDNISGVTGVAVGEIEYYTDAICETKTNAENSGAENEGGAPKNKGTYYAAVKLGDKKVVKEFEIQEHAHKWEYAADGNVIIATCKGEGKCEHEGKEISAVITAGGMIYTGKLYADAQIENGITSVTGEAVGEVIYYKDELCTEKTDVENNGAEKEGGAPKNAGRYYAAMSIGDVKGIKGFTVEKAAQGDITVVMKNYERGGKSIPSINEPDTIKEGATVTFYYNTTGDTGNGILWADNNASKIAAGNYYIYAVLGETTNYKEYCTKAVGFTVYAGHSMGKAIITKEPTKTSNGILAYTCENGCGHTETYWFSKGVITVNLGEKVQLFNNTSVCRAEMSNAKIYKKYFTLDKKTGVISTKKIDKVKDKVKIKKEIRVKVIVNDKKYDIKVKLKIPAPKVKIIKKKKVTGRGEKGYRYTFKYDIKGADKIKVRMKKGGSKQINTYLNTYISKPKSNKSSFIQFSNKTLKKLKNKATFKIVAYYGNNQSETLTITR